MEAKREAKNETFFVSFLGMDGVVLGWSLWYLKTKKQKRFVFLRPAYDGGENVNGGPGSREKEIGFEIPEFPKNATRTRCVLVA